VAHHIRALLHRHVLAQSTQGLSASKQPQSWNANQEKTMDTLRVMGCNEPAGHAAKRKPHQIDAGVTQQLVHALHHVGEHQVDVSHVGGQFRVPKTWQVDGPHRTVPRQRLDIAHPVGPAAASTVQQHQGWLTQGITVPDMPDLPSTTGLKFDTLGLRHHGLHR